MQLIQGHINVDYTTTMESGADATKWEYDTFEQFKFWLVSPLESIAEVKRHCGIFIDIPVSAISVAGAFNYIKPYDIVFSGVMDLN
ncbi:MAG: hypothetical protein EZS28_000794 [Streblomastix strix]|uniref:Uncharacterized protein n=1 Tax=Streblomastix strix TaxID=222440 RepID=A0A5J4X8U9_9EUKA|nr:MAG: hypothetical protein EZS28_000794 [Streblomastix strix]